MINLLGFSAKLADRLINNSLAENLPTGLKTKGQREQQKNQLMKLKGHLDFFLRFNVVNLIIN